MVLALGVAVVAILVAMVAFRGTQTGFVYKSTVGKLSETEKLMLGKIDSKKAQAIFYQMQYRVDVNDRVDVNRFRRDMRENFGAPLE